jgi:NhaP-type Na+/H+ or K+/H+ antiporter
MNDGSAFPFVMLGLGLLGLHDLGPYGLHWLGVELLWGTIGGLVIGCACGAGLARLSHALRQCRPHHEVLDDLMGLGLIAVAYGLTVAVKGWGFLAVFAAGVALRQTELKLAARCGKAIVTEKGVEPVQDTISANSLLFKEHLERLSELTLVLLLGGAAVVWIDDWRGWATALFLFCVARPVSVLLALRGGGTQSRTIIAWFGVRGIGSLYYLMYAINHGLPEPLARSLIGITMAVIMLSIVVHGTSVTPLLDRFWRR